MNHLTTTFAVHFGALPDPRRDSALRQHGLLDILTIALCATLSGAETFTDMERSGTPMGWTKQTGCASTWV